MTECGRFEWSCPNPFGFTDEGDNLDPVEEAVIAVARELDPPSPPQTIKSESNKVSFARTEATSKDAIRMKHVGKVPFYAMVFLAFLNAADEYIDVQQIYAFVMHVFPHYNGNTGEGWRSALRHQLAKYGDSFIKFKTGRKLRYKLIKGEITTLHRKFDVFCSKVDSENFDLAENCSWEDMMAGNIGIPEVQLKTPPRKERAVKKKKDEKKEALKIQNERSDLAVANILKEYNMAEEAAVKIEYAPVDWEMHQTTAWNFGEDVTAAWQQYQQQVYAQNYFYYNPMTFDGNMFYL